jgi:hypothetical protein
MGLWGFIKVKFLEHSGNNDGTMENKKRINWKKNVIGLTYLNFFFYTF